MKSSASQRQFKTIQIWCLATVKRIISWCDNVEKLDLTTYMQFLSLLLCLDGKAFPANTIVRPPFHGIPYCEVTSPIYLTITKVGHIEVYACGKNVYTITMPSVRNLEVLSYGTWIHPTLLRSIMSYDISISTYRKLRNRWTI